MALLISDSCINCEATTIEQREMNVSVGQTLKSSLSLFSYIIPFSL
jgi:hypothetical protein